MVGDIIADSRATSPGIRKHEHVPGLGITPTRKFIAPSSIVLRTAEALRFVGTVQGVRHQR